MENLFINEQTPKPQIGHEQALVKVKAFGLNRADLQQRKGLYPAPPQGPRTLGMEFSGLIEELADQSEGSFKIGDAVFGLAYGGAYAEYIAISTHMLIHKPDELHWEECAGIPVTFMTALQVMYMVGGFEPGKSILWHAGASAVSITGQQLSLGNGASEVYATARSDEKVEFCVKQLGIKAAYNTTTAKWDEEVLKATGGRGVDIIVDLVGPDTFAGNLNAAAMDAHIVNLATLSGHELRDDMQQPDFRKFLQKRLTYVGSSLRSQDAQYRSRLRDQLVEHALPLLKQGKLKVHIEKVLPWTKIQDAHQLLESNQTKGKVICLVE